MNVTVWSHFDDQSWSGDVPDALLPLDRAAMNETLFRLFNRVDAGDGIRLEEWGYLLPSLSVGDRVTWHDVTYTVEPIGFVVTA